MSIQRSPKILDLDVDPIPSHGIIPILGFWLSDIPIGVQGFKDQDPRIWDVQGKKLPSSQVPPPLPGHSGFAILDSPCPVPLEQSLLSRGNWKIGKMQNASQNSHLRKLWQLFLPLTQNSTNSQVMIVGNSTAALGIEGKWERRRGNAAVNAKQFLVSLLSYNRFIPSFSRFPGS